MPDAPKYPREHTEERRSGISDQRLAELETLLALAKHGGGNKDVAYGVIDPIMLGKRKRSYDMDLSNQVEEDFPLDILREARLNERVGKQGFARQRGGRQVKNWLMLMKNLCIPFGIHCFHPI
ncbi:uncharacterized protein TNCT_564261 [Trichonephila clavata]|uniref:Uncharacterized protein n=1 Tax=Trichonephila clavata TaxID=2740835 RepID=A0A8X6GM24_TRICU|nr:uncharacterized protein TNCT_564261 [Trichonephila clavata]